MIETTPAGTHLTATLELPPAGGTPRLRLHYGNADIAPYFRTQETDIHEPDSWPTHHPNVNIAEGKLPRYTGPIVLALPAFGLGVDRIAIAVEFAGPGVMEHLAGMLTRAAARRRETHDPKQVKEAYGDTS